MRLFTFFVDKVSLPSSQVTVAQEAPFHVAVPPGIDDKGASAAQTTSRPDLGKEPTVEVNLVRLAWARSGDKGDSSNIATIARRPEYVQTLRTALTPERM